MTWILGNVSVIIGCLAVLFMLSYDQGKWNGLNWSLALYIITIGLYALTI